MFSPRYKEGVWMDGQFWMAAPQVMRQTRIREGRNFPLGATWDGTGVNFAIFSANATKVELCLFDDTGERELERIELPEYSDEVWHVCSKALELALVGQVTPPSASP